MSHLDSAVAATFDELGREIIGINMANGWNVTTPDSWADEAYKVPAVLALIHSEVSEALEAFRKDDPENFAEEMADVVIRVLDCTHGLGIDLGMAVLEKLEVNRGRGHRHGGKRV
jgi:NTP pyrophosphatase (non-canonical NTP hydrolase)